MNLDQETCYRALSARDNRFDGLFFVGVTTTGIYCRPICAARTPGRDRCRFFANPALAERSGFRPCLRCRPELAPGDAPIDATGRVAKLAAARIQAGALNGDGSIETLASELKLSSRQLRRAIRQQFGVSPVELAQTRRLLLAKQLLTETSLPAIEIAHASGFASVRRFNALFRAHYGMPPTRLRRTKATTTARDCLRLLLAYRPPLAWHELLRFLAARATSGVECVSEGRYVRTMGLRGHRGWIAIESAPGKSALKIEVSTTLTPVLPALLGRIRSIFDLDARPDAIADHLGTDTRLKEAVQRSPGLRVPGCADGFEMAVRAILGQRISVASATTLAGRMAATFGEPIETPSPGLSQLSPTADRLAGCEPVELSRLGIAPVRATGIRELAARVAAGTIRLEPGADPEATIAQLQEVTGVGEWTAQMIAMRALHWPDAFPAGDLGLLRASGAGSPRELRDTAEAWRPWRAYAALYLWSGLVQFENH